MKILKKSNNGTIALSCMNCWYAKAILKHWEMMQATIIDLKKGKGLQNPGTDPGICKKWLCEKDRILRPKRKNFINAIGTND